MRHPASSRLNCHPAASTHTVPPPSPPPSALQFEEHQVTRFLASIEAAGLPCSIVLNKADLVSPEELAGRLRQCASWGYAALPVSCETGAGVVALGDVLRGKVAVVAGPSGALLKPGSVLHAFLITYRFTIDFQYDSAVFCAMWTQP